MDGGSVQERREIAKPTQIKSKVNRLRRSPKSTSQNSSRVCQTAEFKTPTRPARGQFRRVIPEDSPSSDPDCHQDIIWDTTSPSPIRHGRGHRRAANVKSVDISDIANRIAPKNSKMEEADSSLLQWIDDSAIPCTPEVREPKIKTLSTKQNTVEDLMRLAKQFDFNMRQDEAHGPSLDGPVSKSPLHNQTESEREPYQEMDDDLDDLFDGPTQHLSGRLSQLSGCRVDVPENVAKPHSSEIGLSSVAAFGNTKVNDNANEFEDDWNNDSILEDSLVFEMTQNPDLFAEPRSCSTQKQNPSQVAMAPKPQEAKISYKFNPTQGQKPPSRQTFQMETFRSSQQVQKNGIRTNPNQNRPETPPLLNSSLSSTDFEKNTNFCTPNTLNPASTHQSGVKQNLQVANTVQNILNEDLDSFFESDDIWDDGIEDDDLFCEACDNLEVIPVVNHQQPDASQNKTCVGSETVFAHPNPPGKPPAYVGKSSANTSVSLYGPKANVTNSGTFGLNVSRETARPSGPSINGPYKFTPVGRSSATGSGTCDAVHTQQGHQRGVLAALKSDVRISDNNPFMKSYSLLNRCAPVVTKEMCNTTVVRCSDAEIERKKQQALERRRLRMMSNQNLPAPV